MKDLVFSLSLKIIEYSFFPDKLKLPFGYAISERLGKLEPELTYIDFICHDYEGTAIDIGANRGIWSYKLSHFFQNVIAYEINPHVSKSIIAYNKANIEVQNVGLSNRESTMTLYTPVVNGNPLLGHASLETQTFKFTDKIKKEVFPVKSLDSYGYIGIKFIKIDVEGHELSVLEGAYTTIKKNQPIMVIETEGDDIFNFLKKLKYKRVGLKDLCDKEGSKQNQIFIPFK
ncbi:MAG: FkbM family methyltransferase [Cyclobacteriaceae bacterium]